MGTHGTLEWLPGKSIALSGDCCPDYIQDSIPDIYPHVIGNPGEGIQAMRRAAAVIVDHVILIMTRAGSYDEIEELEGTIQRFMDANTQGQTESASLALAEIRSIVQRMELYNDMKLDPGCTDDEFADGIDGLYDYVTDVKGNLIKDGLHILGESPEGELMDGTVYCLSRLDNGDVPSLRGSIASVLGYDILDLQNNPSERGPGSGRLKGEILDDVEDRDFDLINRMRALGFDREACLGLTRSEYPDDSGRMDSVIPFICDELHPNLMRIYGEIGKRMADQMLERHIQEHGAYPHTVGIVVWATDTMKTGGDDIGYILWLMELRPVWFGYAGRVKDIEVIPLEKLGRPRIDVTLRISGLFRDTFPNLVNLIDHGIRMIAELDESDEENYLAANLRSDIANNIRGHTGGCGQGGGFHTYLR